MSTAKSQKARLGKVTAKAIKEVATNIDKRIVRMRKPEVTFPVRSLGNVRYTSHERIGGFSQAPNCDNEAVRSEAHEGFRQPNVGRHPKTRRLGLVALK